MRRNIVSSGGSWRRFLYGVVIALCGFWVGELVQMHYLPSMSPAHMRLFYLAKGISISLLLASVLAYLAYREQKAHRRLYEQLIQSEKLAGVGQLAAGLAHELNTPLASILAYAEELEDQLKESETSCDVAPLVHYLRVIRQQARRCTDITRSLLNFARKADFKIEPTDVKQVLAEAWALMRRKAQSKQVRITQHVEPDIPAIAADRLQLQHAILNILGNALDASEAGDEIRLVSVQHDGALVISVRDTGCGISKEHLPRIFDPFFTTKPPGVGTGLGLSISHGIIRELGGGISVSSKVGQGTEVEIVFPLDGKQVEKTGDG